ncbi:MAG: monovalent cation/H+ antiporter complex subunit F [Clostridia bacterium]|nr:monovalent cation/H+ antiporter complex subunit F [Clostridia bacterium]
MVQMVELAIIFLACTVLLCMVRAIKGPNTADRIIAINVVSTKIIVLISFVSFLLEETYFIDVALTYALISFITSIVVAQTMSSGGPS